MRNRNPQPDRGSGEESNNIEAALGRKRQVNRRPKRLDGQGEAHLVSSTGQALIALACGEPPEGRAGWTLKLLADRLVECGIVESISTETVRQTLKKRTQAPVLQRGRLWLKECWCIPPQGSAEFVCAMEDVLEIYQRRYGDNEVLVCEVLVCLDETSKQQSLPSATTGGERDAPAASGPAWGDGLLRLRIRAQQGEQPVHVVRSARRVAPGGSDGPAHESRLGPGGQATGGRGLPAQGPYCAGDGQPSLYEEFEPSEARRIAERLEIHYTPKHGSWLDMAEIEIGVLARQCLARRIPDQSALRREVGAWQQQRNRDAIRVDWRFTTSDARIKLKSLYPSMQH